MFLRFAAGCLGLLTLLGGGPAMPGASQNSHWVVYHTHGPYSRFGGITQTRDGFTWLSARGAMIHMARSGAYTLVATGNLDPQSLAVGADGRVYAVACCTPPGNWAVLAVTATGVLSTYVPPSHDGMNDGVVLGPDGNIWFSEQRHVANIRPDGKIMEYKISLPDGLITNSAFGIASAAGKVWFSINNDIVQPYNGYVVGVDPRSGRMTQTKVPCFDPVPVAAVAGLIWAGCGHPYSTRVDILQMTPAGVSTVYRNPDGIDESGASTFIATQRDLWFVTSGFGAHPNNLAAFNLTTHQFIDYPVPPSMGPLYGLAKNIPDEHIWGHGGIPYPAAAKFYHN